ncbi:MAG TPA: FtsX-like permease family protein [Edaphocola sp.]|nr:FtsX-like permease family protein [Edaphocola sp.]
MTLIFQIVWRYFFIKKSVQAINIISWISMGAIAVSVAAMIILFSVFNGLDHTIKELYTSFNPELKITPKKGKFFKLSREKEQQLKNLPGLSLLSETIEDMALLSNDNDQQPGWLKGVENTWFSVSTMDSFMISGSAGWPENARYVPAILGLGIANNLRIDVSNPFSELKIYYPKAGFKITLNPEQSLSKLLARPEGLFHIQEDLDDKYVLIPLQAAQTLFQKPGMISAIEIKAKNASAISHIRQSAGRIMGADFKVADRFEQNQTLFMVLSGEKWMVYVILLFVLLLASFNLTGCLYMLVLEKKKDITILKSMGMGARGIRRIFLAEGVFLAMVGAIIGIVSGFLICLGQIYFGWVGLPDGFVISAYPVAFEWPDFVLVFFTAMVIGLLAAWYPAFKAGRQPVYLREE